MLKMRTTQVWSFLCFSLLLTATGCEKVNLNDKGKTSKNTNATDTVQTGDADASVLGTNVASDSSSYENTSTDSLSMSDTSSNAGDFDGRNDEHTGTDSNTTAPPSSQTTEHSTMASDTTVSSDATDSVLNTDSGQSTVGATETITDTASSSVENTGAATDTTVVSDTMTDTISPTDTRIDAPSDTTGPTDTQVNTPTDTDPWGYQMILTLDTTPNGANITSPVENFPVLVRLNENNFDFTEAQNDGEDIRFYGSDGSPLAYEIEDWSRLSGQAAIWVRIPLISPNNDSQFITMNWGNPEATSESDSTIVFNSTHGFLGVWHLNESGNTTANGYKDASSEERHGTGTGFNTNDSVAAIAGNGQTLGGSQYIEIDGLFGEPSDITVSGWTSIDELNSEMISLGDRVILRLGNSDQLLEGVYYVGNDNWHAITEQINYANTGWHHFAFVVDSTNSIQTLFVDGQITASETFSDALIYDATRNYSSLGMHVRYDRNGLHGTMDEFRVSGTTRSEAWLKLCFENQRPTGQTLVVFP